MTTELQGTVTLGIAVVGVVLAVAALVSLHGRARLLRCRERRERFLRALRTSVRRDDPPSKFPRHAIEVFGFIRRVVPS